MADRAPNGTTIGGYVDPNFPNPNGPDDIPIIIYGYTPSLALAAFAASLFAVCLAVHAWQVVRYRSWWFVTVPVALGFEIVGYIARALSAHVDPYSLIFFVLNYFFIVTAPVFLSAGLYAVLSVLLGRLDDGAGSSCGSSPSSPDSSDNNNTATATSSCKSKSKSSYSPLPRRLILAIFVTSDVVTTTMQITGAALIGARESAREDPDVGNNVLLLGLSLQALSMAVFCALLGVILSRVRRARRARRALLPDPDAGRLLAVFVAVFVAATLAIYLRTCFRLAETAQNIGGYLATHEVFFATLEFAPIALAVLLLNVWHPGRCLPREHRSSVAEPESGGEK